MKIALIGDGKTGSKVLELLDESPTIFNLNNPPTEDKLKGHDIIICFTPGDCFLSFVDTFLKVKVPMVIGSTGFKITDELKLRVKKSGNLWIYGSNFAIGMNLIYEMIDIMRSTPQIFENYSFKLHESHHTDKKDAPSGTALTWRDRLNLPCEISSERTGDVIGVHQLNLITEMEEISIKHEALDRKFFANGAIWAASYLMKNRGSMDSGIHYFSNIIKELIHG